MPSLDEMAWKNIGIINSNKDKLYANDLLVARSNFLKLRLDHETTIRRIYNGAADLVASELKTMKPGIHLQRAHKQAIEITLRQAEQQIGERTTFLIKDGMSKTAGYAGAPLENQFIRAIKAADAGEILNVTLMQRGFAEINKAAIDALWARTYKGVRVSDRLWKQSAKAKEAMRDLINAGFAAGRDPAKVAYDLQAYMKHGQGSLAQDYPNMMQRMGTRVPKNCPYEGLRLARTEYSKASFEGTYSRGQVNPAYLGIQFLLSDAHPELDICDHLAEADLYDMGPGVYKKGQEPIHPHPNCLCFTIPYMMEQEAFVNDLVAWTRQPSSKPYLETWYKDIYIPRFGQGMPPMWAQN